MNILIFALTLLLTACSAFPVGKLIPLSSISHLRHHNIGKSVRVGNGIRSLHGYPFLSQDLGGNHLNSTLDKNKFVAMDCEMVGVANNTKSALARVSIVDYYGNVILDKYVKPLEHVSDYRTWVSGIYPHHLSNAANFYKIRNQVSNLLKGKIVIGHALTNDWKALGLMHPESMIRDTSKFEAFKKYAKGKNNTPGLKTLAKTLLNIDIQSGSHDSVDDARAVMLIFKHATELRNRNLLN